MLERRFENRVRGCCEYAGGDLEFVVETRIRAEVVSRSTASDLGVEIGHDETPDPRRERRSGAERARLTGEDQLTLDEAPTLQRRRRVPHCEHRGMAKWVATRANLVVSRSDAFIVGIQHDRSDAQLAGGGAFSRESDRNLHRGFSIGECGCKLHDFETSGEGRPRALN